MEWNGMEQVFACSGFNERGESELTLAFDGLPNGDGRQRVGV